LVWLLYGAAALLVAYLLVSLALTYVVQQIPRHPVVDVPDWGRLVDTRIPASEGGSLEVWRIEPAGVPMGMVVFAHGWGRNRDRMVQRARLFGRWGYTTVIHSARDHGNSSPRRFMNAAKFAEDIESVLAWLDQPVILYGHSAGAGGAIIAAARNPEQIKLLFLEACYADTKEALLSLYRWVNPIFGKLFGPMILFWMNLFYRNRLRSVSPEVLAPDLQMPVMLVHGERDRRFPLAFARRLHAALPPERRELFVAPMVGHSDSSLAAEYPAAVKKFLDRYGPERDGPDK
jgi:pimeloyl-ACP methyl ester carboxylesterase